MLKIAGVILCVAGSAGYGWAQVISWKKGLNEIKIWIVLFSKIKSCLLYRKETLETGCVRIGEQEEVNQGRLLLKIGQRAEREREKEFGMIWGEEIRLWCKMRKLSGNMEQLLLRFPEYMKEADEQLQMELFSVYMKEMEHEQRLLEQKIREQQKPLMAVSLVVGLMLSILLV